MSIIIGYKKDGKLWMAGDSRVSSGTHIEKLTKSTAKIWQENDQLIIGGVGYLHELQFMRYNHFIADEDVILDKVDHEYLFFLYPEFAKRCLDHFGITLGPDAGYASALSTSFMFGVNGHLMILDSLGAVTEYDHFAALGCADDLVTGYILGHENEEKDIPTLLTNAIKYAATVNSGIDTNITIYCMDYEEEEVEEDETEEVKESTPSHVLVN